MVREYFRQLSNAASGQKDRFRLDYYLGRGCYDGSFQDAGFPGIHRK
jgi:hypothetical protein